MANTEVQRDAPQDGKVAHLTAERLAGVVDMPVEVVEAIVRDELGRWRESARIQTFVPIFAERSARVRIASQRGTLTAEGRFEAVLFRP